MTMEIDDRLAAQIHGIISSDSDSDLDSGRDLDDKYQALKPPAIDYKSIKDKIVVIPQRKGVNVWEQRLQNNEQDNNKENTEINNGKKLSNNEKIIKIDADVPVTKKKRKKKKKNQVANIQEVIINDGKAISEKETQNKQQICDPLVDKTVAAETEFPVIFPLKKKKNKKSTQKTSSNEYIKDTNKQALPQLFSVLNKTVADGLLLYEHYLTNDDTIRISNVEYHNMNKSQETFQQFALNNPKVDRNTKLMKGIAELEYLCDATSRKSITKKEKKELVGESTNPSDPVEAAGYDETTSNIQNSNKDDNAPVAIKKRKKKKWKRPTEVQLFEHQVGKNVNLHWEETNKDILYSQKLLYESLMVRNVAEENPKVDLENSNSTNITTMPVEEPKTLCGADPSKNIFNQFLDKEIEERINDTAIHIQNNKETTSPPIEIKKKKKKKKKSKQTIEEQLREHEVAGNVNLHREETSEDRFHPQKPQENLKVTDVAQENPEVGPEDDFNAANITTIPVEEPNTLYGTDEGTDHKDFISRTSSKSFPFEQEGNNAYKQNTNISDPSKNIFNQFLDKEIEERINDTALDIQNKNETNIAPIEIRKRKKKKKKSKLTTEVQLIEHQVGQNANLHGEGTKEDKLQEPEENLEVTDVSKKSPEVDLEDDFISSSISDRNNSTDITTFRVEEPKTVNFNIGDIYKPKNITPSMIKDIQSIILATVITYFDKINVRKTKNNQLYNIYQKLIYHMPFMKHVFENQYLKYSDLYLINSIENFTNRTYIIRKMKKKMIQPSYEIEDVQKSSMWLAKGSSNAIETNRRDETIKMKEEMKLLFKLADNEIHKNKLQINNLRHTVVLENFRQNTSKRNISKLKWKNISLILHFVTIFKSPNVADTFNELGYIDNDEVKYLIQCIIYIAQLYKSYLAYTQQLKNSTVCRKQDKLVTKLSLKDCIFLFNFLKHWIVKGNRNKIIKIGKKSLMEETPPFSRNQTFEKEFPSLAEVYGYNSRQNRQDSNQNQNKNRSFKSFSTNNSDILRNIDTIGMSSAEVVKRQIKQEKEKVNVDMKTTGKFLTEIKDYPCSNEARIELNMSKGYKSAKNKEISKELTMEVTNNMSSNKRGQIMEVYTRKEVQIKSEKKKQSRSRDESLQRAQPTAVKRNNENSSSGNSIKSDSNLKKGQKENITEHFSNSEHFNRLFDVCSTFFEENATIFEQSKQTSKLIQEQLAKNQNVGAALELFMTVNNSSLNAANWCMKMCNEMKDNMSATLTKNKKLSHGLEFLNDGLNADFIELSSSRPHNEWKKYNQRSSINFEDKLLPATETSNCRSVIGLQNSQEKFLKDDWSTEVAQNQIQPFPKFKKPSSSNPVKSVVSNLWTSFFKKPEHFTKADKSLKLSHFDNPIQRLAARKRRAIHDKNKNIISTARFLMYAICIFVIEVLILNELRTLSLNWKIFLICLTFLFIIFYLWKP